MMLQLNTEASLTGREMLMTLLLPKYEGKVDRIVLGETYSMPGQWSSYPSHKHDTDNLPFEVKYGRNLSF